MAFCYRASSHAKAQHVLAHTLTTTFLFLLFTETSSLVLVIYCIMAFKELSRAAAAGAEGLVCRRCGRMTRDCSAVSVKHITAMFKISHGAIQLHDH
jgi:hypothetical protein